MKHYNLLTSAVCAAAFLASPAAHAEDILSILAKKSDVDVRLAPQTIPYSYTLTVDIKAREGKDLSEGQAVLRIDPSQPAGSRAQIISITDADSEALKDFLKEIEDPENTMEQQAESFWCGDSGAESDDADVPSLASDPSLISVLFEDETEAVLRPDIQKLAELLMQSDENADKNGRKMMKKLLKRIEGEVTLAKPSGEMKGFSVRMTRPMTMMLVAKLKEMDVEQTCALAPNGHYHTSTMKMNVQGKALGSRFGQNLDMQVSELTPLP